MMTELQLDGIRKINEILDNYFKPFGCTFALSTDFSYMYSRDLVTYAFVVSERMDNLFMSFAKSKGLKADVDIFLISICHELGHSATYEDVTDEEWNYSEDMKDTLTCSDEDCLTYFNLPDELMATTYAIDYINSHEQELKKFWDNELQPAILDFYKVNEVDIY